MIVRTDGLTAETANQIKNIIIEETGLSAEDVSVGEIGLEDRDVPQVEKECGTLFM